MGTTSARVLLIEDDAPSRELMAYLLRAFGHAAIEAGDGRAGLEALRAERPDVVVCDIDLPGLDGYAIAAVAKADADLRAIPLVAVTALAMLSDRDRAIGAGFDGYIAKPIEPTEFVPQIERFLPPRLAAKAEG
jgi:two-component system cell cycle response regulator